MNVPPAAPLPEIVYAFLDFRLDPRARTLSRQSEVVTMTPKVFDTLLLLVRHAGQVVTKDQALAEIWPDSVVEESNLSQNVFLLRKLLGEKDSGQKIILTRAGVGYSFLPDVREVVKTLEHPAEPTAKKSTRRWLWAAALAALGLAGIAATFNSVRGNRGRGAPGHAGHKWAVSTRTGIESFPALSPDGSRLAFTWDAGKPFGPGALYLQHLPVDGVPLTPLRRLTSESDVGSVICPAWSSDGQRIAFVRQAPGQAAVYLIKSDGTGGERKIRDLLPTTTAYTGCPVSFSADGRALALAISAEDSRSQLVRHALDASSAEDTLVPLPAGVQTGDVNPVYSPDGRSLAFVRRDLRGSMDIFVAAATPDGRVTGEPRQLTRERLPIQGMTWTPDSQAVLYSATRLGTVALWRAPIDGGASQLQPGGDQGTFPSMAASGRLSFAMQSENRNLWRMELAPDGTPAGESTLLLSSTRKDEGPVFSRDGRMLSFFSDRTGSYEIWACGADGSNPHALTAFGGAFAGLSGWSPDAHTLLLDVVLPGSKQDVLAVPAAGGKTRTVVSDPGRDATPSFSRDGKNIYFASDRSGRFQVWRANVDGSQPAQITQGGGVRPLESEDGYLYFASQVVSPEIRRMPVGGGEEETLVARPHVGFFGHWAMAGRRIYFIHQPDGSMYDGLRRSELWLYDLATRRSRKVADLPAGIHHTTPSLAVSPDGKWLVFSKLDSATSDLYVVEPAR